MQPYHEALLPGRSCIDPVFLPEIEHWSSFRCGSYTADWVAKAIGIAHPPANLLLIGPIWFDLFRPITPRDMMELFKARGMNTVQIFLSKLSDAERLRWLKYQIAVRRRPPVLLIRTTTLHWLAVGGYDDDKEVFYVYDPNVGRVSTDLDLPIGNCMYRYDKLLRVWRGRWWLRYRSILVTEVSPRDLSNEKKELVLNAYARGELVHQNPMIEKSLRSLSD